MVSVLKGFKSTKVSEPENHAHYKKLLSGDCIFTGMTTCFESAPRKGSLSVRLTDHSLVDGEYVCTIEDRAMRLNNSECFVINPEQTYSVNIECSTPVDSFAIYFREDTINEVSFAATCKNLSPLLEMSSNRSCPLFFDGYYSRDSTFSKIIALVKSAVSLPGQPDNLWLEETMRAALFDLISTQGNFVVEADRIAAARRSTRIELFRRVRRARNFLDSEFENEISISDVAKHSCLSPFHLQRCFRDICGYSIQGYVRKKRMERAKKLLIHHSDISIESIAASVGFAHHSSFSRAFSQHFGHTPGQSRAAG